MKIKDVAKPMSSEDLGKFRQFTRFIMSYIDFQQAAGIAQYILEQELHHKYPHDRFALQGLNAGMIVAYCRPFSQSRPSSENSIPSLSYSILRVLTKDERRLHEVIQEDRNRVLAHSDSDAWDIKLQVMRTGGSEVLMPIHRYVHAPLLRDATEHFGCMADKLMEACFEKRMRLEPEIKPYLHGVDFDDVELRRMAEKLGAKLPRS